MPCYFEVDGKVVMNLKCCDNDGIMVSSDGDTWHYLGAKDIIRLYEAMDEAGCFNNLLDMD